VDPLAPPPSYSGGGEPFDIISSGFGMFDDDEKLTRLSERPAICARITTAFADGHAQLALLI
jgi:prepilin-type processing-associated H-X9-DG protein